MFFSLTLDGRRDRPDEKDASGEKVTSSFSFSFSFQRSGSPRYSTDERPSKNDDDGDDGDAIHHRGGGDDDDDFVVFDLVGVSRRRRLATRTDDATRTDSGREKFIQNDDGRDAGGSRDARGVRGARQGG